MEEKQIKSSEEIDLLYFLRPITNVGRKLSLGIKNHFEAIRINKFLFWGIIIVLTLAGYCLRFIMKPAYETTGIFISHVLPSKYCSLLLKNLDQLKNKKNIPLLAQQLGISDTAASKILSMRLIPMRDRLADTALSLFEIKLVLSEIQYVDTIQRGIVDYLENNAYSLKRKEARIKSLSSMKTSLNSKLESLDSLKAIVNSSIVPRSQGQGIILGEPINPIGVYQAEVAYLTEQLKIDEQLSTIDNIEVLQPFLRLNEYNYPKYSRMVFYAFVVSIVLSFLLTPILGKKIKKPA